MVRSHIAVSFVSGVAVSSFGMALLPIRGLTPKAKPRSSKALQLLTGLAGAKREPRMSGGNEPLAADMMRMAVVAGIGEATWFTAKKEAGIGSRLDGMPGQSGQHWVWTRAARHGHREFEMAGTGPRSRRRRGAGKGGAVRP
jgi:hypothetical protein